jgi:putative acetyltransferase
MTQETLHIRGQRSTDWQDVYDLRRAKGGMLSLISPDQVRDELAQPQENTWPVVAEIGGLDDPKVIARTMIRLGRWRRGHTASLEFEQHPDFAHVSVRELLSEAIRVAEDWWNRRRLDVTLPAEDTGVIGLFESFGFVQEARLRESVRVAGELVDEVILARVTGDVAQRRAAAPPRSDRVCRDRQPIHVMVRGGSREDWEAHHAIWSQPSVIWGTLQMPHASADWSRIRVQDRRPDRFWLLVAEVDGTIVGTSGMQFGEHDRSHTGRVGMMVDTMHQGKGVGSALMAAAVDLAENWLGLTRIQLEVYPDNIPGIGLYEKFGFEREGVMQGFAFRDGEYVDVIVMARLAAG